MTICKHKNNTISETALEVNVKDYYQPNISKYHPVTSSQTFGSIDTREMIGNSMLQNGQKDAILLWKKAGTTHVVDGRNRLSGAVMKGLTTIYAEYVPSNTTIKELENLVSVSRDRVHASKTQLAIEAFRGVQSGRYTQETAAKAKGVSTKLVQHCSAIDKLRPNLLNRLAAGELYVLQNGSKVDTLSSIRRDVEFVEEKVIIKEDAPAAPEESQVMARMFAVVNPIVDVLKTIGALEIVSKVLYVVHQQIQEELHTKKDDI